jgi:hypothetical protein
MPGTTVVNLKIVKRKEAASLSAYPAAASSTEGKNCFVTHTWDTVSIQVVSYPHNRFLNQVQRQ